MSNRYSTELKDLSFVSEIKSVAVVGISKKNNYRILTPFAESFKGKVYAIKPGVTQIERYPDIPVYSRISDIPKDEPVDYVFISIPREHVKSVVLDCIEKGVKLVNIFAANFADEGSKIGRQYQTELINLLKENNGKLRILGPNGMGLYYPKLGLRWRYYLPIKIIDNTWGRVGLVAQSGGLSNIIIHGLIHEQVNISKAFSIGNAIDVNLNDALNYLKDDEETDFIITYIEGLDPNYGKDFMKIIKSSKKPILIIKAGRSDTGSQAAVTHTAAVVGDFNIWRHAIKQAGGILLDTFEDLINHSLYVSRMGPQPIKNICVLSLSGGYGVICTDILREHGIKMPKYEQKTSENLSKIINRVGTSYNNPLDLAGIMRNTNKLEEIFDLVLNDKNMDGIVFDIPPYLLVSVIYGPASKYIDEIYQMLRRMKSKYSKPIIIIIQNVGYSEMKEDLKEKLHTLGIPVYPGILPVARILKNLLHYKKKS